MRAKLYDVLDTKTGVMIGEGLRCREVSNLIDVDLDHISQYAGRGQRCKRRYIIMPCGEVTAEHPRKEFRERWDEVRKSVMNGLRKEQRRRNAVGDK